MDNLHLFPVEINDSLDFQGKFELATMMTMSLEKSKIL